MEVDHHKSIIVSVDGSDGTRMGQRLDAPVTAVLGDQNPDLLTVFEVFHGYIVPAGGSTVKGLNLTRMVISKNQLQAPPKRIGTLKGQPVMAACTKGGLNLITDSAGKTLGTGPHAAISRIVAKNRNPDIVFDGLAKGEWVDPASVAWLLPRWEKITEQMANLWDELHGS